MVSTLFRLDNVLLDINSILDRTLQNALELEKDFIRNVPSEVLYSWEPAYIIAEAA